MTALAEELVAARLSWQCNYTRGDRSWSLKQLHNLYQFLVDHRDEIVVCCSTSSTQNVAYEKELALLVGDINQHISNVRGASNGSRNKSTHLGELQVTDQPAGVSLILTGLDNPIRYMVAPLAASIAAGNVTILATAAGKQDRLISLLLRQWSTYLDRDCIFLVPEFEITELETDSVDIITIFDTSPSRYNAILVSTKTHFYNTSIAFNLAMITEGKKPWDEFSKEIGCMSSEQVLPSDRIHAVFLRREEAEFLKLALSSLRQPQDQYPENIKPNAIVLDIEPKDHSNVNLESQLQSAIGTGSLLIIPISSLERAIDFMINLRAPIQQLAILGPEAHVITKFVQNWLAVRTLSTDSIYPVAIPQIESQNMRTSSTLFSSSGFSNSLVGVRKKLPSLDNIQDIRASYKNLIVPLKPEPRGERMSFFTQVEYFIKGAGATLGVATIIGLIYGVRAFRHRLS